MTRLVDDDSYLWKMVFKFRTKGDVEKFHDYVVDEYGYETEELQLATSTNTLTIMSTMIDPFSQLAERATMRYIPESVKLFKHYPSKGVSDK